MTKQFTPDLKLKAFNYYYKINNYIKVCEIIITIKLIIISKYVKFLNVLKEV